MGFIRIVASLFAFAIVANGQSNYGGIAGIFNQHPGLKISHDNQGIQYSYSADHMIPQPAPKSASAAPQTVSFPSSYSSGSQQPAYQPTAYQPSSYQQPASYSHQQPATYSQQQPAYQPAYTPGQAYQTSAPTYGDNSYNGAAVPSAQQPSSFQPYSGGSSRPSYYSGAPAVSVAQHNPYQSSSVQSSEPQISPGEALQLHNQQLQAHQKQVQAQEQLIASFAKTLGLDRAPQPQGQQPQQAQYQQYQQYQPQQSQSYGYNPQPASQASPTYKSSYQA